MCLSPGDGCLGFKIKYTVCRGVSQVVVLLFHSVDLQQRQPPR